MQITPQERISKTDSLVPKHPPRKPGKAAQIVQNRTADDVPRSVSVHAPQIIEETVDVVDIEQITTQERVANSHRRADCKLQRATDHHENHEHDSARASGAASTKHGSDW